MLVCQSGARAALAQERLHAHRDNLVVLEGGTIGWQAAHLPLVSEQAASLSTEQQVRLIAGLLVVTGTLAGLVWRPALGLALFVGAGLILAGLTGWCGMALLVGKTPWNRAAAPPATAASSTTHPAGKATG